MKKIITLVWVLFALPFYGQHKVAGDVEALVSRNTVFTHFSPFSINAKAKPAKVVNNATYVTIQSETVKRIANSQPENIEIEIPYNGQTLLVQLYRSDIFASGFHVDTNKKQSIPYKKGAHYRGIIKGDRSSLASFSFFQEEMSGMVSSPKLNNLVVGRLNKDRNMTDYIIYSDSQLNIKNTFNCAVLDSADPGVKNKSGETTVLNSQNTPNVKVSFEMDYELYRRNSSSENLTNNWMTAVFNNIKTLYANDGINVSLASVFIWVIQDPYVNNTTSNANLDQFRTQAVAFDGDVAQLIGIDPGGQGGLAFLSGLCGGLNVSYCDVDLEFEEVPIFSWTVEAMTHELGHQFGSPHTHACAWNGNNTPIDVCGAMAGYDEGCTDGPVPYEEQGTIMSYCHLVPDVEVNLANGFGPQPTERIINYLNSVWCLEPLSVESNTFTNFSYYPNPSTGLVNITSGDEIEELSIYNLAGQLLFTKKVNAAETTVDLSSFANGVYFVKAVNGAKEMNFRVVKQ